MNGELDLECVAMGEVGKTQASHHELVARLIATFQV